MKIRMLSTESGSIDGIRVQSYEAGSVHDLSDTPGARDLAAAFVGAGMATEVAENVAAVSPALPVTDSEPPVTEATTTSVHRSARKKSKQG